MKYSDLSPEEEKLLSMPTYYGEETYNNLMTHIVSLIVKDTAIVVGSDGRAMGTRSRTTVDAERKIYELSSRCVMMYAGTVPGSIDDRMDDYNMLLRKAKIKDVTPIADLMVRSFKNSEKNSPKPLDPVIAIIAGYDLSADGDANPHLYYLSKSTKKHEWGKRDFKPYLHGGIAFYEVKKILENEFDENSSLDDMNKFALRLNREACVARPDSVGGQAQLWNIYPIGPIKKFAPGEIRQLEDIVFGQKLA